MERTQLPTSVGSRRRSSGGPACGEPARPRRDSLVGRVIDCRFHVEARIATGGFGTIYRATHLASGAEVALKVLHPAHAKEPAVAARFRREAAALASLRDPHTVATYELGESADGTLYIAMELLYGVNLFDRLRATGAMAWRPALAVARAVCSSLAEAHALGIVHRDLKPGNIHLEPRDGGDFVKVVDFGVAKLLDGSELGDGEELTRVGETVGTLEYMPPEQLVGAPCDARTDVYALGIVIYEMLTGRRPFADATSPATLVTALLTESPVPPSLRTGGTVPPGVDRLVMRCLECEPGRRFQRVTELADALDRLLAMPDDEATWIDFLPTQRAMPIVPVPAPVAMPAPQQGPLRVAVWLLAGMACGIWIGAMAAFG